MPGAWDSLPLHRNEEEGLDTRSFSDWSTVQRADTVIYLGAVYDVVSSAHH